MTETQAPATFADYDILGALREDQRLYNMQTCGTRWLTEVRAESGRRKSFPLKCRIWRHPTEHNAVGCQDCFDDRQDKHRYRVGIALAQADDASTRLQVCELSNSNAAMEKALRHRITRRGLEFFRLPNVASTVYFFFEHEDLPGEVYTWNDHKDEDWDRISFTPKGKRVSGTLGRIDDDDGDEIKVSVELPAVITSDIDDDAKDDCWSQALQETSHLMPIAIDDVIEAVELRVDAYVAALCNSVALKLQEQHGYNWLEAQSLATKQVKTIKKYQRVSLAAIDWSKAISNY